MDATQPARIDEAADPARWWGVREVVRLAIPSVLTTVSYSVMQFVDGLMVARVGEDAMSAQLTGGMASYTASCFFIGLLWCVSTFASQNLGAGRPERGARYAWQGLWLSLAAAAGLAPLVPAARLLMGLFGHPAAVCDLEVSYFQVLVGGAFFSMASSALSSFFLGMHRPVIPFCAGLAGNAVNFVVALGLIFGLAGLPRLGLLGAGIGSVVGMAVQTAVMTGIFLWGRIGEECRVRSQWRLSWPEMKELVRLGAPAGAMFLGDLLMWTIFMAGIMGRFGVAALAATNILGRYWPLCFMPAVGVGNAVTAIVGRYCGAGRPRLAWRRAHAGLILVEAYMVTSGLVLWLARDTLVGLFNGLGLRLDPHTLLAVVGGVADPEIQAIATQTFIFILLCQAFDALNVIFIGALRGAGDTLWPGIVQLTLAYGVGLGGSAVVTALRPGWGVFGPWAVASVYIAILGLVMWKRFLGGRWRAMGVVHPARSAD